MGIKNVQEQLQAEQAINQVSEAELNTELSPSESILSPQDKLQFAKWVLKGIFIFFMISVGVWLYAKGQGEILMDIFKTGLLPIAAFVIGDYFGSRS